MNNNIKLLIESFSSLFDDDDIFVDDNNLLDNPEASKLFVNDLTRVLIDKLGIDIPRGWKRTKDENNDEILLCTPKSGIYGMSKFITNVVNLLTEKNWKIYKIGDSAAAPFALSISPSQLKNKLNYSGYYPADTAEYQLKQFTNKLSDMPNFVIDMFKNGNGTYKTIMVSPDNGIIFTYQTYIYSVDYFKSRSGYTSYNQWQKATIKLTNLVSYEELDTNEIKKKKLQFKDSEKRIQFLSSKIRKISTTIVPKQFILTPKGLPIGITYFKWDEQTLKSGIYKKYDYPKQLKNIVNNLKFNILTKLEKEDPDAIYECEKNGISIKFYKNIDCTNANNMNSIGNTIRNKDGEWVLPSSWKADSCVIFELSDYNLELFNEIFN